LDGYILGEDGKRHVSDPVFSAKSRISSDAKYGGLIIAIIFQIMARKPEKPKILRR
jgi:hypothetical protein